MRFRGSWTGGWWSRCHILRGLPSPRIEVFLNCICAVFVWILSSNWNWRTHRIKEIHKGVTPLIPITTGWNSVITTKFRDKLEICKNIYKISNNIILMFFKKLKFQNIKKKPLYLLLSFHFFSFLFRFVCLKPELYIYSLDRRTREKFVGFI